MKTFCIYIKEALRQKFDLTVSVYILKKKGLAHFVFNNSFLSYENIKAILNF